MPLIAQLRWERFLKQDPLKLGFEFDERYWEAIAVPERRHARRLADILA